ncbi:MAG: hypothetical protein IJZ19_15655 [Lentisphaeria bacterium]|nr:hypothetical protein [Lentisphaeria bacterium]
MYCTGSKKILSLLTCTVFSLAAAVPEGTEFISEWLVLGPYPNYQTETYAARGGQGYFTDYLRKFGGETALLPDPAQQEKVAFEANWSKLIAGLEATNEWGERETKHYNAKWQIVRGKNRPGQKVPYIWFDRMYPVDDYLVVYAACTIQSPTDRPIQFRIGSDDDNKVWLNGKYVGGANSSQGVIPDNFIYNARLKRGLNNVLVKIVDRTGDFGFCFAVTDRKGKAMPDLKIHTVSPEIALRKANRNIREILDYTADGYLASCGKELFGERSALHFVSSLPGAVFTLKQSGKTLAVSQNGSFDAVLQPGKLEVLCKADGKQLSGTLTVHSKEKLQRVIADGKAEIRKLQALTRKAEKDAAKLSVLLKNIKLQKKKLLKQIEEKYASDRAASAGTIGAQGKSENKPLPAVSGKRLSLSLNGEGWSFARTNKNDWKNPEKLPAKWLPADMPFLSRDAFFRTWYYPLKLTDPKNAYGKVVPADGWNGYFWSDDYCSPSFRIRRTVSWNEPVNGSVFFRCKALCGGIRLFVNGKFEAEYRSSIGIVDIPLKHFKQGENLLEIFFERLPDPKNSAILQNVHLWGGFRGDVSLEFMPECRVDFAWADTSYRKNQIRTETEITNSGSKEQMVEVRQYAVDKGRIVKSFPKHQLTVKAGTTATIHNQAFWTDPVLWGIGDNTGKPYLYELVTDIVKDGTVIDRDIRNFGFREVWSAGTNIFINGKRVILQGDVGWGNFMDARKSSNVLLNILRNNGINIVRNHDGAFFNSEFFDLCDRRGMWVYANMYPDLDEGFNRTKKIIPVKEWLEHPVHKENLLNYRRWVRMVRNHPSVIILSSDNEIYTQAWDSLEKLDLNLRNDAIGAIYGRYVKKLAPGYIITRDGDVGTWGWEGKWQETPPCETANYHYPNFDIGKCTVNWQDVYGYRPLIYGEAVYCGHFRKVPTPELLAENAKYNRRMIRTFREEEIPVTVYMGITGEGFVSWDDTGKGNPWGVSKTMAQKGELPFIPFYAPRIDWPANSGPGRKSPVGKIDFKGFGWRAVNWFHPDYPTHRDSVINKVYREELISQPELSGDTAAECVVVLQDKKAGVPVRLDGREGWISYTDKNGKAYFLLPEAGEYTVSACGRNKNIQLKDMSGYCNKPGFKEVPHINL